MASIPAAPPQAQLPAAVPFAILPPHSAANRGRRWQRKKRRSVGSKEHVVRDFHWIDPEFVSLVAAHRLDALEGRVAPDVTEGLITAHRSRVTIRPSHFRC